MIAPMSPIWAAKLCASAFSVTVLVSAGEFSKMASMRRPTSAACDGSAMRTTYQPTIPLPYWRASSK